MKNIKKRIRLAITLVPGPAIFLRFANLINILLLLLPATGQKYSKG